MDESSEENSEYEHRGWPGDGSGEDDFAEITTKWKVTIINK